MEEIMSKTDETPKLGHATPTDRRMLDDTELTAVIGGSGVEHSEFKIVKLLDAATPKLYEAACKGTHLP
jgi:type VI protein secretion system component Hcp